MELCAFSFHTTVSCCTQHTACMVYLLERGALNTKPTSKHLRDWKGMVWRKSEKHIAYHIAIHRFVLCGGAERESVMYGSLRKSE